MGTLTLNPKGIRLEQQCRIALAYGWPEHLTFCRDDLAPEEWSPDQVRQVAAKYQQIARAPGIEAIAERAAKTVDHWRVPASEFQHIWEQLTTFFAKAAELAAAVTDRPVQTRQLAPLRLKMKPLPPNRRTHQDEGAWNRLLGHQLNATRLHRGLSLDQVAERAGLTRGYVAQLERGTKQNPTLDTLVRLAKALDTPPGALLGATASSPPETAPLSLDPQVHGLAIADSPTTRAAMDEYAQAVQLAQKQHLSPEQLRKLILQASGQRS